ncbi:MAG: phytanoyl-CoA dioxygenase family protein [Capsulimonadales bacterium]|nr:phytanoyl-CoA dioxygenase family protein [Capsulimonadales bacterium]
MTDTEKYLFDLNGYLALPEVLTRNELDALNSLLDERIAAEREPEETSFRFRDILTWGRPYRDLLAHPRVLPYLHALVGERCRLDHEYLDVIRQGLGPIGAHLHGGGAPHDPSQYYRVVDGRMYNGLIVAVFALKDVRPGDGGFACIPGSHKANFPLPAGWGDMTGELAPGVTPISCPAGSVILFTEALTHGTLPWRGTEERRSVFLKYSPHFMAWSTLRYDPTAYPDLSLAARRMLEGPNSRYRGRPGAVEE